MLFKALSFQILFFHSIMLDLWQWVEWKTAASTAFCQLKVRLSLNLDVQEGRPLGVIDGDLHLPYW